MTAPSLPDRIARLRELDGEWRIGKYPVLRKVPEAACALPEALAVIAELSARQRETAALIRSVVTHLSADSSFGESETALRLDEALAKLGEPE